MMSVLERKKGESNGIHWGHLECKAKARPWWDDDDDLCVAERDAVAGKAIYMVSDGTGWTAEHSVSAALGQFEHCLVDRRCSVSTHLFSGVNKHPANSSLSLLPHAGITAQLLSTACTSVLFCHLTIELVVD